MIETTRNHTTHGAAHDRERNRTRGETALARRISDMMQLSTLCRRAGCYRAKACRGEPRACLARYAPLVPDEARDWVKAMLDGMQDRLDFDEVLAAHADEFEAYADWLAMLDRIRAKAVMPRASL